MSPLKCHSGPVPLTGPAVQQLSDSEFHLLCAIRLSFSSVSGHRPSREAWATYFPGGSLTRFQFGRTSPSHLACCLLQELLRMISHKSLLQILDLINLRGPGLIPAWEVSAALASSVGHLRAFRLLAHCALDRTAARDPSLRSYHRPKAGRASAHQPPRVSLDRRQRVLPRRRANHSYAFK
jgi:hypothetical protein